MKLLVLVFLALASCAHQATEATKAVASVDVPMPGIRERIVPGTTYGNTSLQAETVEALKDGLAAYIAHGGCSLAQINVSDAWAPDEPTLSEFSSSFLRWKELWTLDVCGSSVDFEVVYMRHRTGIINVSVSPQEDGQAWTLN